MPNRRCDDHHTAIVTALPLSAHHPPTFPATPTSHHKRANELHNTNVENNENLRLSVPGERTTEDVRRESAIYKEHIVSRGRLPSTNDISTHPHRKTSQEKKDQVREGRVQSPRASQCLLKSGRSKDLVKMSVGISEVVIQSTKKEPSLRCEHMK